MAVKQSRYGKISTTAQKEANLWATRTVLVQVLPRCFIRQQSLTPEGLPAVDKGDNPLRLQYDGHMVEMVDRETGRRREVFQGDRIWATPEEVDKWTKTECDDRQRTPNRPIVRVLKSRTREQALNNVGENLTDSAILDGDLAKTPMEGDTVKQSRERRTIEPVDGPADETEAEEEPG